MCSSSPRGMSLAVAVAFWCIAAGSVAARAANPDKDAFFGEEHIHTSWSVDAWLMGNRLTGPDDAYKYAQGQTIKHPMGFDIKIDTPPDFMGLTEADGVGPEERPRTSARTGDQRDHPMRRRDLRERVAGSRHSLRLGSAPCHGRGRRWLRSAREVPE